MDTERPQFEQNTAWKVFSMSTAAAIRYLAQPLKTEQMHSTVIPETYQTCTVCASRRIKITTRQTRSLDEGPTSLYECSECLHKWRD
jgi:DNA-directed RNA polymerase subunit M/transcription elongation factor TFIIS